MRDERFKVALQVALAVQDVMREVRAYHGRAEASKYSLQTAELASFMLTLSTIPDVDSVIFNQNDNEDGDEWPSYCLPLPSFNMSTSASTWPSHSSSSSFSESWSDMSSVVSDIPVQEIEQALRKSLCRGRSEVFLADLLLFFRAP